MKVILNKDLATLGEVGDVKDVARGYARNYLFPRGIALPYTPKIIKMFEARKEEIEAHKAKKRADSLGLKERLENLEISIAMPAGANGKLYGSVTSQTVCDELAKLGAGSLRIAAQEGDAKNGSFMAGQSAGLVKKEQPAAEMIAEMFAEFKKLIKSAGQFIK